jgi:S-adenosylmethionine hydrolase
VPSGGWHRPSSRLGAGHLIGHGGTGSVDGVPAEEPRFDTVSFLTDYGTRDEFVGVVKAVIRDLAPHVTVLDLTHEIAPFDVRAGSLALARCMAYVPSGVVLAVVDPGVGTDRRAVAIEVAGGAGVLVGPDNGLLAPAVAMAGGAERAVSLTDESYHLAAPGATFAGRDVFAPVAAHLCNGVDLGELGEAVDPALLLPGTVPLPRTEDGGVMTEVLWIDRYGNCQLNVGPDDLVTLATAGDRLRLEIGLPTDPTGVVTRVARRADAFAGIAGGGVGLVLDSYGMLALSIDRGSAADHLGVGVGDQVFLTSFDAGSDASFDDQASGAAAQVPVAAPARRSPP